MVQRKIPDGERLVFGIAGVDAALVLVVQLRQARGEFAGARAGRGDHDERSAGLDVLVPAVAVIGDSTFTHSGMTGLLDCVNENSNVTIVISDNETTAMTGGQDSAGTGRLEAICAGIGVAPEHIRVVVPLKKNYEEMKQIIREEIEHHGVSVIIPRRECIQTLARKKRNK